MAHIKKVPSFYSNEQLSKYLSRINANVEANDDGAIALTLDNLTAIMRGHLVTFPFENTAMHYSAAHTMDVSPNGVYDRLIEQNRNLGTYCFGHNTLLMGMLRAIGFRVYSSSGRVNWSPPGDPVAKYTNLSHMVLFVAPEDHPEDVYLTDVGFGGGNIVRPVKVIDGETVPGAFPPEEHRLSRVAHPTTARSQGSDQWVLEVRNGTHTPDWRPVYMFDPSLELFLEDYDAASFAICMRPVPPFWPDILVVRHVPVDGGLARRWMRGKDVKQRAGEKEEALRVLKDEGDRVAALRELFNIDLSEEEAVQIQGRDAALNPSSS